MTPRPAGWLWTAIGLSLVAWFVGLLLILGPLVHLLLLVAAVLLAVQVVNERAEPS